MKKLFLFFAMSCFFVTTTYAGNKQQLETNKKNVVAFYDEAINHKNFHEALKYIGSQYIQHNPAAQDGTEGLNKFIQFLRDHYPKAHSEIKRVFAEGDYVILHVHAVRTPGTRGNAIVDIFRLEQGKIVEHWDVIQEIPEKSENDNGMF